MATRCKRNSGRVELKIDMYITYETRQFRLEDVLGTCSGPYLCPFSHPTDPRAETDETSQFRPTYLVRTKDMEVVRGSTVQEAYYALSYSWNQSGDILVDNDSQESFRIDNGKHKIVSYRMKEEQGETKFVKFEGLIQQICQDFNVQYIWYDQMCIDQNNPNEKRREMKQMHKIYKHAQCTIVLVPEFLAYSDLYKSFADIMDIEISEWSKRAWTLEEALMSQRLLFIGSNVHLWSHIYDKNHDFQARRDYFFPHRFLHSIATRPVTWSASDALWHMSRRTSTKLHDRVFALANIFPEFTSKLRIDYREPLLDTMLHFYSLVAQHDLSILCFGSSGLEAIGADREFRVPEEELLPSWTGAKGFHAIGLYAPKSNPRVLVDGLLIHLTCNCIHVTIEREIDVPVDFYHVLEYGPNFVIHPSSSDGTTLNFVSSKLSMNSLYGIDSELNDTHWLPVREENSLLVNTTSNPKTLGASLSLTDRDCAECIILCGVIFHFRMQYTASKAMPVVRNDGDYYTCIGTFFTYDTIEFSKSLEKTQTFILQ